MSVTPRLKKMEIPVEFGQGGSYMTNLNNPSHSLWVSRSSGVSCKMTIFVLLSYDYLLFLFLSDKPKNHHVRLNVCMFFSMQTHSRTCLFMLVYVTREVAQQRRKRLNGQPTVLPPNIPGRKHAGERCCHLRVCCAGGEQDVLSTPITWLGKERTFEKVSSIWSDENRGTSLVIAERLLQIALLYFSGHVVPVSALLILDFIYAWIQFFVS